MRVLLADGLTEPSPIPEAARDILLRAGNTVTVINLLAEGFGEFMNAAEREAYHEADNLVTVPQRASAELLLSHDALLVCAPLRSGTVSPIVKSWFERAFVPGVSFSFGRSGKITRGLTHVRRVGMVVVCGPDDPLHHLRDSSTRSVLRAVRMNCSRRCRTTYLALGPAGDVEAALHRKLRRW